jgi:hypothetical protein
MGVFFAVAQIFIISALLFDSSTRPFLLWSCNNFCILLIIACYRKDIQMIMGISYLGLVSQIVWVLDFSSHLLGFNLSGVTDYIYTEGFTYANDVSIAVHVIVPTVILMFSFRVKPKPKSLLFAIPYILFLYVATIMLTPAVEDVNCVFHACGNGAYLPYSIYLWPMYAVVSTLISFAIHYLLYYGWGRAVVSFKHLSTHKTT